MVLKITACLLNVFQWTMAEQAYLKRDWILMRELCSLKCLPPFLQGHLPLAVGIYHSANENKNI